ncbi:SCO6745 family protein [Marinitenerispora sediminis]|uniref:SCO6745 family protein n=1 Tax=Marinitenerispora sediminis TaxID=1931232 RepID=UPI0011C065A5|nr:hypothetical protein [Marinitenerispora sediminis]
MPTPPCARSPPRASSALPDIAEAAGLARRAALSAIEQPHGRPLFAAHATLDWPDEPHLVLWHAQTLLREFRGDGHLAALLTAGLDPVEALVTHAAAGQADAHRPRTSRGWPREAWASAADRLRDRGQVTGGWRPAGRTRRTGPPYPGPDRGAHRPARPGRHGPGGAAAPPGRGRAARWAR